MKTKKCIISSMYFYSIIFSVTPKFKEKLVVKMLKQSMLRRAKVNSIFIDIRDMYRIKIEIIIKGRAFYENNSLFYNNYYSRPFKIIFVFLPKSQGVLGQINRGLSKSSVYYSLR